MGWFAYLGIVSRHDGRPATYERNDAYFEWRRIDELEVERTVDELQARASVLTSRIAEYEAMYGVPTPAEVDAVAVAEQSDERTIDDIYTDLTDWATACEDRERYEQARQQRVRTRGDYTSLTRSRITQPLAVREGPGKLTNIFPVG